MQIYVKSSAGTAAVGAVGEENLEAFSLVMFCSFPSHYLPTKRNIQSLLCLVEGFFLTEQPSVL